MSTPTPSHKAALGLIRDVSDGDGSNVGDNAETILDGVQSVSVSRDGQSTEISELNEAGVRRLLGREDISFDIELNFDPSDTGTISHRLLSEDDQNDDIQYRVTIDFDNTVSGFGMAAVCKVENFDIDISDGAITASFTMSNSDGNTPATSTGVQL
jgi:hypothetical protein